MDNPYNPDESLRIWIRKFIEDNHSQGVYKLAILLNEYKNNRVSELINNNEINQDEINKHLEFYDKIFGEELDEDTKLD